MAGGYRSALPLLGLSAPQTVTQGGYRSHLWRWGGGASARPAVVQGGYRSLLAFWMGGASAGSFVPPTPRPSKGGIADPWKPVHDEDEEEILIAVMMATAMAYYSAGTTVNTNEQVLG
jgi:hypothetical protein